MSESTLSIVRLLQLCADACQMFVSEAGDAGVAGEVSSPGSIFSADSYFGIHSTPLPQKHIKDCHSAKSEGGRLQLNMHASYVYGFA